MKNKRNLKNVDFDIAETSAWFRLISFRIGRKQFSGVLTWNSYLEDEYEFNPEDGYEDPNLSQEEMHELVQLS